MDTKDTKVDNRPPRSEGGEGKKSWQPSNKYKNYHGFKKDKFQHKNNKFHKDKHHKHHNKQNDSRNNTSSSKNWNASSRPDESAADELTETVNATTNTSDNTTKNDNGNASEQIIDEEIAKELSLLQNEFQVPLKTSFPTSVSSSEMDKKFRNNNNGNNNNRNSNNHRSDQSSKGGNISRSNTKQTGSIKQSSTGSGKVTTALEQENEWNFEADYNDHFETPLIAYQDLHLFLTSVITRHLHLSASTCTIYDPYFCQGRMVEYLQSLGFSHIINHNQDFYEDIRQKKVPGNFYKQFIKWISG